MQAVEHYIEKFVPEHYDLFLDLNRETKTFSGNVTITGQAKNTAQFLELLKDFLRLSAVRKALET